MNSKSGSQSAIETIYGEREDFIILGLTGRTGSGCSYVAKFLENEITDFKFNNDSSNYLRHNEQLKYSIVNKYFMSHKIKFHVISMTDVILTFLFDLKIDDIIKVIYKVLDKKVIKYGETESFVEFIKRLKNKIDEFYINNKTFDVHNFKEVLDKNCKHREDYKFKEFFDECCNMYGNIKKEIYEKYKIEKLYYYGIETSVYSYFMQKIGNLIRKNGFNISDLEVFTGKNMYDIAERTGNIIKEYRKTNASCTETNKTGTFICVDAIRNPFEATYFQDRFANFYLIAISTTEEERKNRLINSGYTKTQIQMLDAIEYPELVSLEDIVKEHHYDALNTYKEELEKYKNNKDERIFYQQNIGSCLQIADIYINNLSKKYNCSFETIEQLLIKYIVLILHPGIITPSSEERCMQIANVVKLNSGCLSRQVGAVITDENYSVKAVGWNTTPQGQTPCNLRDIDSCICGDNYDDFSKYEIENSNFKNKLKMYFNGFNNDLLNGRKCLFCFKDIYNNGYRNKNQVHTRSLHAEENAFLQLSKYGGEGIMGGNLFTTASPCVLCSKKAVQLGIKKIYYIDPYTDIAIDHILSYNLKKDCSPKLILFSGAVGKAYTFLYSQKIPIKDELNALRNNNVE